LLPVKNTSPYAPDWFALAATAVTLGIHLLLMATTDRPNAVFIGGACVFWAAFVLLRARRDRTVFRQWGFRADNLGRASVLPAILLAVAAAGMAGYAGLHGTLRFPAHTGLLFLFYPVWGVIQQFLTLGIVVGNLERVRGLGERKGILVLVSAALFGLIHVYDVWLAGATFLLELAIVPLFLKYRNVWPLGALHGWLGGFFYLWVLNRDLWVETFG
jgi:hypothetical protein